VARFGERGFDYAGNSSVDLAVWPGARQAIVVNASKSVQKQAAAVAKVAMTFGETDSPFANLRSVLNELFIRSGYLVAIAAGLLLATAFPKINFAGGAWVAPALLAFAGQNKKGADAFRVGVAGGLAYWLVSLCWLLYIPFQWHSIPVGPGAGWLALCAVLSVFSGAWVWLISSRKPGLTGFWGGRLLWSLGAAASWVALEMVRARLFGGFPWDFLGVSQFRMIQLIQIASITGVYGVSFLVVWTSLSFYLAGRLIFSKPRSRFAWQPEIFPPLLAVAILFAWGEFKMIEPVKTSTTLHVTVVQPSIPQNLIWDESLNSSRFQQLLALSESALTNQTDLLIWPESAVPEFDNATYAAITNLVYRHQVWLIFNADDVEPRENATNEYDNDVYNAAFLFSPHGDFPVIYHKQKLVIFGEYIPLASWLPFMKWLTPIPDSYQRGTAMARFSLGDLQCAASPLICYEDMFPQMGRKAAATGADFLVNVTNDGWFGESAEQWQHETSAIFRTVENDLPLVRCCNNGVTCWIDNHGYPRQIFRDQNGSAYGAGAMTFDLPLPMHAPTFYTVHGDFFGWGCVVIALGIFGLKVTRQ
jgi:apolipoprotein N-acyltransferase